MTADQNNVVVVVRGLFDLLMVLIMTYTMVMQHENRKDYERVYQQNQAILEALQATTAPTISVDMERRIERVESAVLIDHKSIQALEAGLEVYGYKLDEILKSIASQGTISRYMPAIEPVSLSHETRQRSLDRESLQLQSAVAWLKANDRGLKLTTREAERLSGISRATINRAQHWIRNE